MAGDATACYGTNSGTVTLSGQTGNVVKWQYSIDGGSSWSDITNTATTQSYTNLTQTTQYRAVVQSGSCSVANSFAATITISPASVGGSLSGSTTVCYGDNSVTLNLSGYTGNIVEWQSSTDNWNTITSIANSTNSNLVNDATVTTKYRVVVKSGVCSIAYSSEATITVDPLSVGGTISGPSSVCSGTNSSTLTLSGNTGTIVKWQSSVNGWVTISDIASTSASIVVNNVTATTRYRAVVQNGTCPTVNSVDFVLIVDPVSVGGTVSGTATVCSGSNNGTLTLNGQTGNVVKWQSSTNGGSSWSDIANTTLTYNYTNVSVNTIYRAVVQSGVCSFANSGVATITVTAPTVGGTVTGAATVCSGTNSGTVTLSGNTGSVTKWQYSTDGGSNWTDITNTSTTQTYTNLTATTQYRAVVQNGGCAPVNSSSVTITVSEKPSLVITNPATVCAPATIDLTASAITAGSTLPVGTVLTYWRDAGTTLSYDTPTTANAGTYYIKATSPGNCIDIKPVVVTVQSTIGIPVFALGTSSTICNGVSSSVFSATATPSLSLSYDIDGTSKAAGNTINTNTGLVTFASGWTGTIQITATATGCGSPSTAIHSVLVKPSPTVTVVANPSTAICLGSSVALTVTNSGTTSIQTFSNSSGTINQAITDNSRSAYTYPTLTLSGSGGATLASTDVVMVTLNITHTYDSDLDIFLVDPSGTRAMLLSSDNGSGGDNYTNTILQTDASNIIGSSGNNNAPFTGTYRPEGTITAAPDRSGAASNENGNYNSVIPANALNGAPIDGAWSLRIFDDYNQDVGTLNNWSLSITKQVVSSVTTSITGPGNIGSVSYSGTNNLTATAVVTPSASGNNVYTVASADDNGCTTTQTVTVSVLSPPTPTITADYCTYRSTGVQLTCVETYSSYQWKKGGVIVGTGKTVVVDLAGEYTLTVSNGVCSGSSTYTIPGELVTDGSFENYNSSSPAFYTQYTNHTGNYYNGSGTSGLYPEGDYAVDKSAYGVSSGSPKGYHPDFHGRDHTSGTGNFMMVNGSVATSGNPPTQLTIWQQTVTVKPNTDYYFSAWAMNLVASSPAKLQFEVNGVLVGSVADLNFAPKPASEADVSTSNWVRFYSTPLWNSGSATTAVIRIRNLNTDAGGNDFGLDDISFATLANIPFAATASNTTITGGSVCAGETVTLTASISGGMAPITYSWVGPSGYTSNSQNPVITNVAANAGGTYTVSVVDGYGCAPITATTTVTINPTPYIVPQTTTICSGSAFSVAPVNGGSNIVPAGTTYTWTAPTGSGFTGGSAQTTGVATITQTLTNTGSTPVTATYHVTPSTTTCTGATFTLVVTVNAQATVNAGSNQAVCSSSPSVTLAGTIGGSATSATWSGGTGAFSPNANTLSAVYTPSAAEISGGGVTLTLTTNDPDGAGPCSAASSSMRIVINSSLQLSTSVTQVACFGGNNGAINLNVTNGGTSPTFTWTTINGVIQSGQANAQNLSGLVTGTYSVTVVSSTGCSATISATITQPSSALTVVASSVGTLCSGSATGSINLTVTGGTASYTYSWTASGGGVVPSGQSNSQNISGLTAGTYSVTVTDARNCVAVKSVVIGLAPNTAPVISTCPPDYVVSGCGTSAITGLVFSTTSATLTAGDFATAGGVATDNCSVTSYQYTDTQSGSCPIRVTRTYVVSDASGLTASCQQIITISDTSTPTWTTAANALDRTLECSDFSGLAAAELLEPVATDNCSGAITYLKNSGVFVPSSSCSKAGSYTNSWVARDACGNTGATFTQVITVIDSTSPTWTTTAGALNATVSCDDPISLAEAQEEIPVAYDLCDAGLTVVSKSRGSFVAGSCSNSGTYTNIWSATDACGNVSADFIQTITVVDNKKPTWTTPPGDLDRYLNCSDAAGLAAAQALFPVAVDNCDADVTNIVKVSNLPIQNGTCIQAQKIVNTWTVTDDCGNKSGTYTQTIYIDDNTAPEIYCPPTTAIAYGESTDTTNTGMATASDNCDAAVTITYADIYTAGGCSGSSTLLRIWTATDDCENYNTCTQTITIQDITSPVFVDCTTNTSTMADSGKTFATITLPDTDITDNASSVTLTWTMTAPTVGTGTGQVPANFHFNIGVTTITYRATDGCGNWAECSFSVTVIPNDPPVIACLSNIQASTNTNTCTYSTSSSFGPTLTSGTEPINWTWTMTGATSSTGTGQQITAPYLFNLGTTTITWVASNIAGTSSCTQTVSVVDTTAPTYSPSPTTVDFCVINIQSAVMSSGTLQVTPAPTADYALFKHGADTSLDLNMANATDNCCSSGLTIRWEIHFSSGQAIVSGTGQPSTYATDIQLWGDGVNNQTLTHEIRYWIKDCNGNEMTSPIIRTINVQPRPKITTN